MIPSQDIGEAVDSVRKTDAQDFSNLMPRPGWQQVAGLGRDLFLVLNPDSFRSLPVLVIANRDFKPVIG